RTPGRRRNQSSNWLRRNNLRIIHSLWKRTRGAPLAMQECAAFNGSRATRRPTAGGAGDRVLICSPGRPGAPGGLEEGPARRQHTGRTRHRSGPGAARRSAQGCARPAPSVRRGAAGPWPGWSARAHGPSPGRAGADAGALPRDRGLALLGLPCAGLGGLGRGRRRLGLRLRLRDGDLAGEDVAGDAPTLVELDPARADLALDDAGRLELEAALGDDGAADPAADHGVLRHHIALHHAVLADPPRLSGADRALDGPLDPERSLGLTVADDAHPRPDDRDDAVTRGLRDLIVLRHRLATRLEVLRSSESTQHHGCLIMTRGSMASPFRRTSKWRCGAVERPVEPLSAMTSCRSTRSPGATNRRDACPYIDSMPPPWSISTNWPYTSSVPAAETTPGPAARM